LIKTEGAGYAIAGLIDNYGAGGVYLINTASEGTMLWNKTYGGLSGERRAYPSQVILKITKAGVTNNFLLLHVAIGFNWFSLKALSTQVIKSVYSSSLLMPENSIRQQINRDI